MATTKVAPQTPAGGLFGNLRNPARRGSTHRTEFLAGLTTFVTMAYIIFVNTAILSDAGLNKTALIIGTILAAAVPTILLGIWADLPWALAPGMGYNALFAYTVVIGRGVTPGAALALVFLDGLAFLLLVIGPWREKLIMGIPLSLKLAAGAGIGLFIAFIGLVNAGIVKMQLGVNVATAKPGTYFPGQQVPSAGAGNWLLALSRLDDPAVVVALVGLLLTALLLVRRVRGALLLGIVGTAAIAWIVALVRPETRPALLGTAQNPSGLGSFVALPDFGTFFRFGFAKMDFAGLFSHLAVGTILLFFLTFLVADMMDSFGTFSGLATKLGILDKRGNFPRSGRAMIVDAGAGMFGPLVGTATVATYIESAAGVSEGGKTGLTAVWTAGFFLLALFFTPFVGLVPAVATAPALIIVGFMMIEPVVKIGFHDLSEGLPAFLALLTMPVTYSIADGMFFGVVSYVLLKLFAGRVREISWVMWLFAALLLLAKLLDAAHI